MEKVQHYEKVSVNEKEKESGNDEVPPRGYGVRHTQILLYFMCLCIAFISRAQLGVTIVAMIDANNDDNSTLNNHTKLDVNDTNISNYILDNNCTDFNNSNEKLTMEMYNESIILLNNIDSPWNVYRSYKWPKSTQEMVLGSFFLGYMIMMFPSGMVCQRWGGKLPLQVCLLITGIVSILTPSVAVWGDWKAVCFTRILTGMAQAGTYPGTHTLVAQWVPLSERGFLGTYVYTGSMIGTIIALQLGGFLAATPWGWPSTFWVAGGLSILAFVVLTVLGAASPLQHASISVEERNFILGRARDGTDKRRRTPWRAILTSKPVWAAFVAHVGTATSFLFCFTQVPSYLHFIQKVDVRKSGLLSSLPYLGNFLFSLGMGALVDFCTNRQLLTIKQTRIISNTIANVGPAVCLAAVSFTTSTTLAVACLVVTMTTLAGTHTGWMVNYIDLAPNYSGALMASGNTLMNVMAVTLPVIVSNVVTEVTNPYQWRIVLFLVAALGLVCNGVFVACMSSDVQPWNDFQYRAAEQENADILEINGKRKPRNKYTVCD